MHLSFDQDECAGHAVGLPPACNTGLDERFLSSATGQVILPFTGSGKCYPIAVNNLVPGVRQDRVQILSDLFEHNFSQLRNKGPTS